MPNPWLNEHKSTAAMIYFLNVRTVETGRSKKENFPTMYVYWGILRFRGKCDTFIHKRRKPLTLSVHD